MLECNEFYEIFQPNKVKYKTPGRDWDEDGLASWYIEEIDAPIDGELFLQLLAFLNRQGLGDVSLATLSGTNELELINKLKWVLVEAYDYLIGKPFGKEFDGDERANNFKNEVKLIIDEYHEQWEEE